MTVTYRIPATPDAESLIGTELTLAGHPLGTVVAAEQDGTMLRVTVELPEEES
jgi:hypothetical protein